MFFPPRSLGQGMEAGGTLLYVKQAGRTRVIGYSEGRTRTVAPRADAPRDVRCRPREHRAAASRSGDSGDKPRDGSGDDADEPPDLEARHSRAAQRGSAR
jgi:hypothetical protein